MRSNWFGPSQKCAMRALDTPPPPLTTKVPWKLRRLAASWMRISQARTSLAGVADAPAAARLRRRPATACASAAQARVSESDGAQRCTSASRSARLGESTVALRRNADGTPSAELPANCLCAAR